jgi:Na+/H+-dicarboxylate symporter
LHPSRRSQCARIEPSLGHAQPCALACIERKGASLVPRGTGKSRRLRLMLAWPPMSLGRVPFFLRILVGMLSGAVTGFLLGPQASPLGLLGTVIVGLIKALAAPLLFLAILDAFIKTEVEPRQAVRLIAINAINASFALAIGLGISGFFKPGTSLKPPETAVVTRPAQALHFAEIVRGYFPTNLMRTFTEDALIPVILIAVLFGWSLRKVLHDPERLEGTHAHVAASLVETAYRTVQTAISAVVKWIPLAVFGAVAKVVGEQGFAPVRGLSFYLAAALTGMGLQVFVIYQAWIIFVVRMPLRHFWKGVRDAVVYALGASSSLATLPITLRSLREMGVSDRSSTLAACVGTNLNNDSILLYEAMAALFVAQAYGIHLSFHEQLAVAGCSVIAGVGIAGVPDAGLISLSLVLTTVGLPVEILPLLLSVDWILSRARAASNVIADFVSALVVDRVS